MTIIIVMTIRFATKEDAPALLDIYNQYIETPITFETELPSLEEFTNRIDVVNAYALVTGPNRQSIHFHRKCGFKDFATFSESGIKDGKWIDVIWFIKVLNGKSSNPPELKGIKEVLAEQDF